MKISFIGTGLLGNPIAEKLLEAGNDMLVFNRTIEKTRNLKEKGAKVAFSFSEALHNSEIVILMLSDGKAVEEVLFGSHNPEEINYSGQTIIQMGTISPEENKSLAGRVIETGGEYVESPVLGSIPQAKSGSLLVFVGGTVSQFRKLKPILDVLGEVFHIGEVGKASLIKLAYNQLIASLTTAFSLSLGLIRKGGIDTEQFMAILRKSAQYAPTFDRKLENMVKSDYSDANFPLKHLMKDVKLIEKAALNAGLNPAALKGVEEIISKAIQSGNAEKDYSALYLAVNP